MKKKKSLSELIEEEYLLHNEDEDDEIYWCKEALKKGLTPIERKIYITYLENDCIYTATAKTFNVSTPTLTKYIQSVKGKIIDYIDKHI